MTDSSFAHAQQRVVARRQAREAQAAAAARVPPEHGSSRAQRLRLGLQRLPFPLNQLGPAWDAASSRQGTRPAFRVAQVDAELLDDELVELLKGQAADALKYFGGGHLHDDWSAEMLLALRAVLFKLTVWDHDATWEDWLLDQDDGHDGPSSPRIRLLSRWTERLTTAHSAAALVSFLVFLVRGRYRTLLDRVLRMRLAPPTSHVSREVSFEYLNRQLVWHAFTEFLLFVLPLIGINRWRRWLSRTWRKTKDMMRVDVADDSGPGRGEYAFLPERMCAICYQEQNAAATTETEMLAAATGVVGSAQTDVTNPYETMPCACVYCFVCLATRLEREEGEGWTCLRCGEHVKECRPWSGDVLEPEPRPRMRKLSSVTKTVAFSDDVAGGEGVVEGASS
ncbi:peroxisomal biogenesis factor 2 [Ophiocordyceps sinensis CO18]|uniref:Peroxisomal biogenesis factor 2 n=1 Tax=Ophiocordyceps sinensis (strain Co18 / CGMCC 3.14243) TaxID=911162 RepID=T5A810_OPHSC|nr:peroxisomal biogenesis factor 2 [Ophiocordyceps sinensis CO18]